MTVYPQSLGDYMKNWPSPESFGKICFALAGRPMDLNPQEKAIVSILLADGKRMDASQEEKRERWREKKQNQRKTAKTAKVETDVPTCPQVSPTDRQTYIQTDRRTDKQTTEPNNARTREVAAAKPPFGSGDVSPKVKQQAEENVETLRETYVAQFVRTLRSAENCGNPDGPFYDGDVPLEFICCALAADNAVGTWRAYIHKLGADAVREECVTFYHECTAGEVPDNRAAALNARLKALCDMENA